MTKDPSPKADGLRAMREAMYGHLQAHGIVEERSSDLMAEVKKLMKPERLIAYAGKDRSSGGIPYSKNPKDPSAPKSPRKRQRLKRKIT